MLKYIVIFLIVERFGAFDIFLFLRKNALLFNLVNFRLV